MTNVDRLTALGLASELALEIANQIAAVAATVPDAAAIAEAIADKTEIAALTSGSDAADIVAALQA